MLWIPKMDRIPLIIPFCGFDSIGTHGNSLGFGYGDVHNVDAWDAIRNFTGSGLNCRLIDGNHYLYSFNG